MWVRVQVRVWVCVWCFFLAIHVSTCKLLKSLLARNEKKNRKKYALWALKAATVKNYSPHYEKGTALVLIIVKLLIDQVVQVPAF